MRGMSTTESVPPAPIRLGPIHFWVAGAVLVVVVVVSVLVFSPVDTESVALPPYERTFGFRGGQLSVRDHRGETLKLYGLITVDPAGPLSSAGFQAGDVPVAHHGGADEFAWALGRSECGRTTTISVVQASAWAEQPVRRLTIPAQPRLGARGCEE